MTQLCDFSTSLTCPRCGYKAKRRPTYRACRRPPRKRRQFVMVGDLVEKWLTRIGVTKERVERWTRTTGKPGGCGCAARQRWLNQAGVRVQVKARSLLHAVWNFYMPHAAPVDGKQSHKSR